MAIMISAMARASAAPLKRSRAMARDTAAVETWSDAAICGREGSRILVASVPVAANAARTAICRKVEETSGRVEETSGSGAVSIVATVWSVMEAPAYDEMIHII